MDTLFTSLEVASHAGDVNSLKELLQEDKHLLEKVIGRTSVGDNPLHIAAMLGHADFVREVIYHKPELAKELNSHGLSPLHLAATHGHVTVLKELLKMQNGDLDLGEMIRAFGGKTAAQVSSEAEPVIRYSFSSDSSNPLLNQRTSLRQPHSLSTTNDIEKGNLELEKEKNEKRYNPKILLLVATLVATVTFQAVLNPPGGYIPDDDDHKDTKGQAVLGDSLNYFQICIMFSLFSSVSAMMLLLCVVPRKKNIVMKFLVWVIWGAAFSMGLAFTAGISVLYDYEGFYYDYGYDDYYHYKNHWYSAPKMFRAWLVILRLGISWVLIRIFILLRKKSELWEPVTPHYDSLKEIWFLKWKQLSDATKIHQANCCELFTKVIYIVLIIIVLAGASSLWASYKYIRY